MQNVQTRNNCTAAGVCGSLWLIVMALMLLCLVASKTYAASTPVEKRCPETKVGIDNETMGLHIEVTIDDDDPYLIKPKESRVLYVMNCDQATKHILIAKAYTLTSNFGKKQVGHEYRTEIALGGGGESLGSDQFAFNKALSTDDFLPRAPFSQAGGPKQIIVIGKNNKTLMPDPIVIAKTESFFLDAPIFMPKTRRFENARLALPEEGSGASATTSIPFLDGGEQSDGTATPDDSILGKQPMRHRRFRASAAPEINICEVIRQMADKYDVPTSLLIAVIDVESAFNADAVSRVGAMGLMQLMPGTCKRFGVEEPFNPRDNIEGGAKYLKFLLDQWSLRFSNERRLELSLAAYNAGEGAVRYYGGIPPYRETMDYVKKVMKRYQAEPSCESFVD